MTTKTWQGQNGNFNDVASWSPAGTPVAGDIAIITSGTVSITGASDGPEIDLAVAANATTAPTLAFTGTLKNSNIVVTNNSTDSRLRPTILVGNGSGSDSIGGKNLIYGYGAQITIGDTISYMNGSTSFIGSGSIINGSGVIYDQGTLAFVNPDALPGNSEIRVKVYAILSGTMALGSHANLQLDNTVSSGITVIMNDGAVGSETLQLNDPADFSASIKGFSKSDVIGLKDVAYTSAAYASKDANSGILTIFNGTTQTAQLSLLGQYRLGDFAFSMSTIGSGASNLLVTTSAVNNESGGLPPGYENGKGGTGAGAPTRPTQPQPPPPGSTALPMYRFFDTIYGTHLFTASIGEATDIVNTRHDLHKETNGFGAGSATDTSAVTAYRLFSKANGTHFFTTNQNEYIGLTTQGSGTYRADLVAEPSATFYEHGSHQAGDTAVYRFFDQKHGTQFLTGDAGEYKAVTTAGGASYRPDLTYEGIAFYAPAGSFS